MTGIAAHCGDCLAVLPGLAPDSFDACVTDPPYHLVSIVKRFGKAGSAPINNADEKNGRNGPYHRASAGFMGKQWDGGDIAARPETWAEVYRVLKPGAHLVAFGGTRTYHRLACAIEDAGFEIRDCIFWLYGSGFPKSHDVSKGIDRRKNWSALPLFHAAVLAARKRVGISQSEAARRCGLIGPDESLGGGGFMWFESSLRVPTREQYQRLKAALTLDDACDSAFEAAEREVVGQYEVGSSPGGFGDHRFTFNNQNITAPATDAARQWEGWGTALKPACEPIVLARKPLSEGTVAANVLRWGTGAINVDGCRVESESRPVMVRTNTVVAASCMSGVSTGATPSDETTTQGRWPANVAHDGSAEVVAGFPETQSGNLLPGHKKSAGTGNSWTNADGLITGTYGGDSGSAARFFYTAKADGDERIGSKHPTVKPLDLLQWLVRLVTPKGGTVLDPFAGTGITGEAAWREGAGAVLVEREAEYYADIERRLRLMRAGPDERAREILKAAGKAKGHDDLPLFAERQWSDMWAKPFDRPELLDDEAAP
jgi:site-specific DNA-methyltransferase (adenine-specific)